MSNQLENCLYIELDFFVNMYLLKFEQSFNRIKFWLSEMSGFKSFLALLDVKYGETILVVLNMENAY